METSTPWVGYFTCHSIDTKYPGTSNLHLMQWNHAAGMFAYEKCLGWDSNLGPSEELSTTLTTKPLSNFTTTNTNK